MSHKFLTEIEIHRLLSLAELNKRDLALLYLAASTALRSSDLLRVKVSDVIDQDGDIIRMLRLKMKKTGRYIERPLREDCRNAIREWLGSRDDSNPYLFCSMNNGYLGTRRPINRAQYHRAMKKYLGLMYSQSELQGCSTHTLRRSVAKLVHNLTGKIVVAQQILGHSSPVHTIRYLDPEEIQATANKVVLDELKF